MNQATACACTLVILQHTVPVSLRSDGGWKTADPGPSALVLKRGTMWTDILSSVSLIGDKEMKSQSNDCAAGYKNPAPTYTTPKS